MEAGMKYNTVAVSLFYEVVFFCARKRVQKIVLEIYCISVRMIICIVFYIFLLDYFWNKSNDISVESSLWRRIFNTCWKMIITMVPAMRDDNSMNPAYIDRRYRWYMGYGYCYDKLMAICDAIAMHIGILTIIIMIYVRWA